MEKSKFCPALWFSGFFGLGALAHLVRSILGFSVVIAGREIPVLWSVVIAAILGGISAGLLVVSIKKPCETGKDKGRCCN